MTEMVARVTGTVAEAENIVPAAKSWGLLVALLGGTFLLCLLTLLLPHSRYVRFQQFDHSGLFKLRWDYERIHYDPTPIDVAIIGSSRVEAALSAPDLEAALSAKLGRPIHVANLAVPFEGRNLHYEIARELLASHPETKIILLSVVERADVTHPAFRYISDTREVLGAPLLINHYYVEDAAFLPYRQMLYFAETSFPEWFGVSTEPRRDYWGTNFDSTQTFRIPGGRLIDRYHVAPLQGLNEEAAEMKLGLGNPQGMWIEPKSWYWLNQPLEPGYTIQLSDLAKRHHVSLLFVHLPFYSSIPGQYDREFYERLDPLLDAQQFCGDPLLYADGGHFNRYGVAKVSPWLASAIDPYLEPLRESNQSHN